MSYLRAAMRRLDPWAALLLGVLLALGVVILLATPGPWQRVVGQATPVKLTPPVPDDVAVFVLGGRGGTCSGVVWLHADAKDASLAVVVVAPRAVGFAPGAGFAPLSSIVDAAGPRAAAAALGAALDVKMDAWVTLDRHAMEQAFQPMFPMNDVRAARGRYREARAAWRGRGGAERSWTTQYETLRVALPQVAFAELNVVAFSNYVLGFGFVQSDLTLQGATSLADALRQVDPARLEVRAAAVVIERCRGGEVWHVDSSRIEPLRQSLAFGLAPPEGGAHISRRVRRARVLVVAALPGARAAKYADEVRRSLRRSAGAPIEVRLVAGSSGRLAYRAARALDAHPALGVLVAPAPATADPRAAAAVERVCEMLRSRQQEAVVAGPLPARAASSRGSAPRRRLVAVVSASRLPISWLPGAPPAGGSSVVSPLSLEQAARANAQTFVRACWPGALAPRVTSTRLGFAFVAARHATVGVAGGSSAEASRALYDVRLWGFSGVTLATGGGWQPRTQRRTLYFRAASRTAASVLADDLGLAARDVVRDDDAPRGLVLAFAD